MFVPVYVARQFNTILEDCVWQPTECERCRVEWAFRVRLSGRGRGESPYGLDDAGAERRAKERALAALQDDRRFVAESGLLRNIPCPGCGWYQSAMVDRMRAAHGGSWGAVGAACIAIGTLLVLRGLTDGERLSAGSTWLVCGLLPIAGGIASLVWRRQLQRRYDPNASVAPLPHTSAYRAPESSPILPNGPRSAPLEAITREHYESVCTEAAARGLAPPPAIAWLRTGEERPVAPAPESSAAEPVY